MCYHHCHPGCNRHIELSTTPTLGPGPAAQLGWLVEELREQLCLELDFRHEAANAAAMAAAFAGRPEVAVPPVFAALSSERVLTMQWLEGCKVGQESASAAAS